MCVRYNSIPTTTQIGDQSINSIILLKMSKLNITDKFPDGRYRGRSIESIIEKNKIMAKKTVMSFIKKGVEFDEDVLSAIGITKNIRNVSTRQEIVERPKYKPKALPKDKESLNKILDEINTLTNFDDEIIDKDDEEAEDDD